MGPNVFTLYVEPRRALCFARYLLYLVARFSSLMISLSTSLTSMSVVFIPPYSSLCMFSFDVEAGGVVGGLCTIMSSSSSEETASMIGAVGFVSRGQWSLGILFGFFDFKMGRRRKGKKVS